jgi:hypothetical protein
MIAHFIVAVIAVLGCRPYPVYDLLSVPLSMSSPSVPSVIANSPHFYRTAGLFGVGDTGRAWGGLDRRRKSGRSGA